MTFLAEDRNKLQQIEKRVEELGWLADEFLTEKEIMSRVSGLLSNFSGDFRLKGGVIADYMGRWKLQGNGSFQVDGNDLKNLGTAAWLNEEDIQIDDLINARINTQEAQILAEWTFGTSGAFKMATDANNGLWLSPTGILGKKAGVTTFTVTNSGDATFKGTIAAGSVIAANIDAANINVGTLTGFTIQTASTGKRLRMQGSPANEYQFLDGNTKVGHLKIDDDGDGGYFAQLYIDHLGPAVEVGSVVGAAESVYFNAPFISTSGRAATGTVKLMGKDADSGLTWSGSNTATWSFNLGSNLARVSSDIQPSANATYALGGRSGSNLYGWGALRLADGGNIGYVRGSSTTPVIYVGYNTTLGYNNVIIDGDLFPFYDDDAYLGLSARKWARVYSNDYLACPLPAVDSALDKIKQTKKPHLLKDKKRAHHGKDRKYFDIEDMPEECIAKPKRKDEENDIEIIRTVGFLFSAVKELTEKLEEIENKIKK